MLDEKQIRAKEYLKQIANFDKKEERLVEEMIRLRSRWTSATAQLSDMPRPPSGHRDISDFMVAQEDLEERLKKLESDRKKLRDEIEDRLDHINPDAAQVLSYRYLSYMKWEEIAEKMAIDLRYAYKLHDRGLSEL